MTRAEAARIWAELEQKLISCGLVQSERLERERPALIRMVGDALHDLPTPQGQNPALKDVGIGDHRDDRMSAVSGDPLKPDTSYPRQRQLPYPTQRVSLPVRRAQVSRKPRATVSESHIEKLLSEMLERSCSRRTGYDGDDSVDYEPR